MKITFIVALLVAFSPVLAQGQKIKICNLEVGRDAKLDAIAKAEAAGADTFALQFQTPYDSIQMFESSETTLQNHLKTVSCAEVGKILAYGVYSSRTGTVLVLATGATQGNQPTPQPTPPRPTPPQPPATQPPAPSPPSSIEEAGRKVLQLTNQARAKGAMCGNKRFPPAPPLTWNPKLYQAALAFAKRLATDTFFGHTDPADNSTERERMIRAGYNPSESNENIAAGNESPEDTVKQWLSSSGHCSTMMSADYKEFGAAFATNPNGKYGIYWVEVFGTPR